MKHLPGPCAPTSASELPTRALEVEPSRALDEPGASVLDAFPETPLEPLPQWIGRFQILERLGKGGQGLVVRALDPQHDARPLALKILLTRSRGSLLRFRREFQAVHQLDHRHVVRVYESGFYRGFPYFTMEFIEGANLRTLIWQSWGGAGSPALARHLGQLLELTGQVVEALGYIHSRRLVHRDLKPDNIMVSGESVAKLMDFGLAKDLDDRAPGTMVGTVLGTAAYMAPEQILGRKELDGRTDFYALGVTLYELLTGEWPFAGDTDWSILQRHLNEDPRPPREIAPWLDPDVERLVLRLMAREPQDRPSSPQEILAQLDPLLARGGYEPPPGLEAPRDLLVPALVGHAELGPWLERLVDRLTEGESGPQVGFIGGRAGYGKSRVLDSIEEWSQRRMLPVCRANCRQEKRSPFSAFAPLIESLGGFWSKLDQEDRQQLAPVTALVPGLEPRPQEPARLDARHAFHATLRLLELALGRQTMIYLIDDFHWADELSVDFLQTLARRPSALPLLILTSYRPEQMEAPLSQVLESDPGSEVYLRKELAPLDGGQLAELAASALGVRPSALSEDLLRVLGQIAQGSPLVALQTLQRQLREGWLRRANGRVVLAMGAEASSFFSATVLLPRAEAPQSSEEKLEAQILDLCAVYGTGLPMELLLAIIEDEEPQILNALNKLIQRRILRAIRTDEAFEFAQRAIRDEVYERIPEARRLELHGTVAKALEMSYGDDSPWFEALAYHYRAAGQAEAALRFLERSVKKSLRLHAYRDAVRLAAEALDLFAGLFMDQARWVQRNRLLTDQSEAWYGVGRLDEALNAAQMARTAAENAATPRLHVGAESNLGFLYTALRQFELAGAHYETALALAREHRLSDLEARVLNNLGNLRMREGQSERAWEQVQSALETASRLGDESVRVNALLNLAELDLACGRLEEARQRLSRLQGTIERPGFESEAASARTLQATGWRKLGQWVRAEQLWREALQSFRRLSHTILLQRTLLELAELEVDRGRLSAAEDWLMKLAEPGESSAGSGASRRSRKRPLVAEHELASVEESLQGPNFRLRFRRLRAEIELGRCLWSVALPNLEALQAKARLEDPIEGLAGSLAYGRALAAVGQFREAAKVLDRVESECSALGVQLLRLETRYARLLVDLETNRVTQEILTQLAMLEEEAEERGARHWVRRIALRRVAAAEETDSTRWQECIEAFSREESILDLEQAALLRVEALLKANRRADAMALLEAHEDRSLGLGLPWLELQYCSLRSAADATGRGTELAERTLETLRQLGAANRAEDRNAFIMRPAVQLIRRRLMAPF